MLLETAVVSCVRFRLTEYSKLPDVHTTPGFSGGLATAGGKSSVHAGCGELMSPGGSSCPPAKRSMGIAENWMTCVRSCGYVSVHIGD